jgi:hypothetical protein
MKLRELFIRPRKSNRHEVTNGWLCQSRLLAVYAPLHSVHWRACKHHLNMEVSFSYLRNALRWGLSCMLRIASLSSRSCKRVTGQRALEEWSIARHSQRVPCDAYLNKNINFKLEGNELKHKDLPQVTHAFSSLPQRISFGARALAKAQQGSRASAHAV